MNSKLNKVEILPHIFLYIMYAQYLLTHFKTT